MRAGLPTTMALAGTSWVTTLPAPTMAPRPIVTPGKMVALAPMDAPCCTSVFANCAGYCLLRDQKIIIVNKFFTTEGKINILLEILRNVALNTSKFSEKNMKLYEELTQEEVKL